MKTGIDQARDDLARWESYLAADQATLRDYQQAATTVRARIDVAERTVANLREVVQRWDFMHARREPPNAKVTGTQQRDEP